MKVGGATLAEGRARDRLLQRRLVAWSPSPSGQPPRRPTDNPAASLRSLLAALPVCLHAARTQGTPVGDGLSSHSPGWVNSSTHTDCLFPGHMQGLCLVEGPHSRSHCMFCPVKSSLALLS